MAELIFKAGVTNSLNNFTTVILSYKNTESLSLIDVGTIETLFHYTNTDLLNSLVTNYLTKIVN